MIFRFVNDPIRKSRSLPTIDGTTLSDLERSVLLKLGGQNLDSSHRVQTMYWLSIFGVSNSRVQNHCRLMVILYCPIYWTLSSSSMEFTSQGVSGWVGKWGIPAQMVINNGDWVSTLLAFHGFPIFSDKARCSNKGTNRNRPDEMGDWWQLMIPIHGLNCGLPAWE